MRSRTELMFQVAIEIRMGKSVSILRATAIRGRGGGRGLLQYPLVIDREQAGVGPPATVKIVERDRGVVALRIGDRPLPQPEVLRDEHHQQPVAPDYHVPLLYDQAHTQHVGNAIYLV